ncbi:MAG: hypothetical protein LWW92_11480 [Rhodocyclales bacterium]|nr:hypothetical protein [Rhodocyclales bacterium]
MTASSTHRLAACLVLLLPFALCFDGQVHVSQGWFLSVALGASLVAALLPNPGASLLLLLGLVGCLVLRFLAVRGLAPVGRYLAAQSAFDCLFAGSLLLALLPLVFRGRAARLRGLLCLLPLLLAAWSLLGWLGLDPLLQPSSAGLGLPMGRNGGPVESPIVLAGLLGSSVPLLLWRGRWGWDVGALVLLVVAGMQGSWTGWLAGVAGGLAMLVSMIPPRLSRLRRLLLAAGMGVLLCLTAACLLWHHGPGADQRLMLWAQALQGSRPLGWGPGSWSQILGHATGHASPYSAYVLVLWEYGWLGLALVLAGLWHALRRAFPNPGLFGALVGLAVASGGTLIWEQPVAAVWGLGLLSLVEAEHESV